MMTANDLRGNHLAEDALRELCSIGSGNAVTSLNRMLGRGRIELSLAQMHDTVAPAPEADARGLLVRLGVEGAAPCDFLAFFDEPSVRRLAELLLGRECEPTLGAVEESALLETVNIISCSFLGALAALVDGVLMPTPPTSRWGELADLWREELVRRGPCLVVSSRFVDASLGFSGRLVLVTPTTAAVEILHAVGVEV